MDDHAPLFIVEVFFLLVSKAGPQVSLGVPGIVEPEVLGGIDLSEYSVVVAACTSVFESWILLVREYACWEVCVGGGVVVKVGGSAGLVGGRSRLRLKSLAACWNEKNKN